MPDFDPKDYITIVADNDADRARLENALATLLAPRPDGRPNDYETLIRDTREVGRQRAEDYGKLRQQFLENPDSIPMVVKEEVFGVDATGSNLQERQERTRHEDHYSRFEKVTLQVGSVDRRSGYDPNSNTIDLGYETADGKGYEDRGGRCHPFHDVQLLGHELSHAADPNFMPTKVNTMALESYRTALTEVFDRFTATNPSYHHEMQRSGTVDGVSPAEADANFMRGEPLSPSIIPVMLKADFFRRLSEMREKDFEQHAMGWEKPATDALGLPERALKHAHCNLPKAADPRVEDIGQLPSPVFRHVLPSGPDTTRGGPE